MLVIFVCLLVYLPFFFFTFCLKEPKFRNPWLHRITQWALPWLQLFHLQHTVHLHATDEKANFHRLTRLLMCGGFTLLREKFDSIHPPVNLPIVLGNHRAQLQTLRGRNVINQQEWKLLYPSPGVYGKSTEFDITLLFKLFRNICSLTPPGTGWDSLPNSADLSLEADLARIKFYRNEVYSHNKTMEISDVEFVNLWREIKDALLRIADSLSSVKERQVGKDHWQCFAWPSYTRCQKKSWRTSFMVQERHGHERWSGKPEECNGATDNWHSHHGWKL